ncbi:profilin [Kitasatospora sp. NPDC101155]|uniref:profilin n=1 Tax=Kitasatospora sp. NPDC101155 TaxID=3364097 RepID=UPI00380FB994
MTDWQSYVDDDLLGGGLLTAAVIIDATGGATLAHSDGYDLKDGEGAAIIDKFEIPLKALVEGVAVNGITYTGVEADDRSIYGKNGDTGVALARTSKAIVIGYYNAQRQPELARLLVDKVASYLV